MYMGSGLPRWIGLPVAQYRKVLYCKGRVIDDAGTGELFKSPEHPYLSALASKVMTSSRRSAAGTAKFTILPTEIPNNSTGRRIPRSKS